MESLTYDSATAAVRIGAPSEHWLIVRLRSGVLPGRKIGRHWRLTDQDIADALEICANNAKPRNNVKPKKVVTAASGLTPTSRKRVVGL